MSLPPLGKRLRISSVHNRLSKLDATDAYTGENVSNYAPNEVQVDHCVECQMFDAASRRLELGDFPWRTVNALKPIVNGVGNLNATTRDINRWKGGTGGAYNLASNAFAEGKSMEPIEFYAERILTRHSKKLLQSVHEKVVSSWEDYVKTRSKRVDDDRVSQLVDGIDELLESLSGR